MKSKMLCKKKLRRKFHNHINSNLGHLPCQQQGWSPWYIPTRQPEKRLLYFKDLEKLGVWSPTNYDNDE